MPIVVRQNTVRLRNQQLSDVQNDARTTVASPTSPRRLLIRLVRSRRTLLTENLALRQQLAASLI